MHLLLSFFLCLSIKLNDPFDFNSISLVKIQFHRLNTFTLEFQYRHFQGDLSTPVSFE